jgi:hypothetical protein
MPGRGAECLSTSKHPGYLLAGDVRRSRHASCIYDGSRLGLGSMGIDGLSTHTHSRVARVVHEPTVGVVPTAGQHRAIPSWPRPMTTVSLSGRPADTSQGHVPQLAHRPSGRCRGFEHVTTFGLTSVPDEAGLTPRCLGCRGSWPDQSLKMVMVGGELWLRLPAAGRTDLRFPKAHLLFVGLDVVAHPI